MLALRNTAGNFYVNDKPTGAVVGQQPFGVFLVVLFGGSAAQSIDRAAERPRRAE